MAGIIPIEKITMQLGIVLDSEFGDSIRFDTEIFGHNEASDARFLQEFDERVLQLRKELEAFLQRRRERNAGVS